MTRIRNWKTPALLLVLLSIAGFCLANGRGPLLLLAWALTLGGWWFSERKGGQYLPRWSVLSLVLGVVVWAFYRATTQQVDVTLFCEFLTMVLIVKAWDRKLARDISQLIAMAIFLIIGAILDNNSIAVGAVVLIGMPLSAWAVMAMQIGAGHERSDAIAAAARLAALRAVAPAAPRGDYKVPAPRRLTIAVTRQLVPITALSTLIGCLFAISVFLFIPRGLASGQWGSIGEPSRTMRTGFTDEVALGQAGLLTESQRTVLEVNFSDEANNTVGGEGEVFYLRGAVLDRYVKGRWTATKSSPFSTRQPIDELRDRHVRQRIDLREELRRGSQEGQPLFALWYNRVLHVEQNGIANDASGTDAQPGQVWYLDRRARGSIRYTVTSMIPGVPAQVESRTPDIDFPSQVVRRYAVDVLKSADVDPDPATRPPSMDATVVRILTGHLRGKFEYTTEIGSPRSSDQDPIEWFLTEARKGHCEYFASALAALCRSVGINARVVAGYIAAEFNPDTGIYTVRESNAHAWNEVELGSGHWVTFDPTPPVALMNVHERQPTWSTRVARLLDFVNDTWNNSVVMFDNQQQRQMFDLGRVRVGWLDNLSRRAARDYHATGGRSVFKYVIAIAAILGAAVVLSVAAVRALSGVGKVIRRSPHKPRHDDPALRALLESAGFYDEALELLEKAGFGKPAVVPPAAHARALARRHPHAAAAFKEITELFYSLRFGRRPLDPLQAARAQSLLISLRDALAAQPPAIQPPAVQPQAIPAPAAHSRAADAH